MSVKEDSVPVQKSVPSHKIQVLRGRTGNIVKVLSDRTAVFRDRTYGDITFTEDVLKLSMKKEGISFRSYFPVGKTVYYDIEVAIGHVKCLSLWVSKNETPNFSCPQPSSSTPQRGTLRTNVEYRGTVIKMLLPFAFVVEVNSCKIPVFVFNTAFKPNHRAANLRRDQPVSLYVTKGDTVYVTVYRRSPGTVHRRSPGKEFEWSACKAWMEESNIPEPSTSSEDPFCKIIKKWQHRGTPIMKGKLSFVGPETACLESTDCNSTVSFHRGNAFLLGVPVKGSRLDHIFRTGEELSFILSGDDANEASCVWFGSFDVVNQSFGEKMKCILKYCMEREICHGDRTTIVQELGKQRPPDGDKQDLEDELDEDKLEETLGYCATSACSELSAGSAVGRELNGSCENKIEANQTGRCDVTEQTTLLSATATSSTMVRSSAQNISRTTVAINESGSNGVTQQHTTASRETSGILTASEPTISNATAATQQSGSTSVTLVTLPASEPTISNATAATQQSGSTSVTLVTMKQNVISAGEQVNATILTLSTTDTVFSNESHVTDSPASNVFMDSTIQSNTSSEVSKTTQIPMNTNSKVRTDSSKYNCNRESECMNQSNRATDKESNSMVAYVSGHVDTSVQHMDLHKVDTLPFVSDMETETLCFSNCDNGSEFYTSIINKDVERNLKASLMLVLKKQVGESASQILAPYAMAFLKEGIDCMMQELMGKVLSSVMCKETEQKNLNSDLQCGAADGLMITSMVQEWKEEMLLVTNECKAEKKKEMETVLDRAQKVGERISALRYSYAASTRSNTCGSSSNDNSVNYNNDGTGCIAGDYNEETAEKSTLVGIVQDFMQLRTISDCQMVGMPKSVSEQGSQTISTGHILYMNCLSDL